MRLTRSGVKQLAVISKEINAKFEHIPNNCLLVAEAKKSVIGRGKIKSIKIPKRWNATKTHIYLEVDGYILDSGLMRKILLD